MKIIKYINDDGSFSYGSLISEKDLIIQEIENDPFNCSDIITNNKEKKIDKKSLLPPCDPSKIVCFAINFEGITGFNNNMAEPLVFLKSKNSLCLNHSYVKIPFNSNTWGEAEIGVVIKKISKNVNINNINDFILGYIISNDISCSNIDNRDHHLARAKSADGFCPISNYIDTNYDPTNKKIESFHNEVLLRKGFSDQMFWNVDKLISWLSSWMTLYPGDIILTGSPGRVRDRMYLKKGDTFTCKIDGFSELVTYFE